MLEFQTVLDSTVCLNLQMLIRILVFIFVCAILSPAKAQLPVCNMYHFTMTKTSDNLKLSDAKFLTVFNDSGYNNQPYFFSDDELYFTTNYYEDDQTEIAKFDFFEEVMTRITYTQESEYSPIRVPGENEFSCVRVEMDGETQTLSIYPEDGIGYPKRYMNNTSNIGYHCWIDENTLGLFLVEDPYHNLAITDVKSERRKIIIDKIGRTLKVSKTKNLLFVHKLTEDNWYIKSYDNDNSRSTLLAKTLPGREDFELLNDGSLLMGSGSILYRFIPGSSTEWVAVLDLASYGISNISRLIVRKNRMVIVDTDI